MSDHQAIKSNKRKRKKSFLQTAKKHAKRGYLGNGSNVDEVTYQYFVQLLETYKAGFESEDDKIIVVNNSLKQSEGKEIEWSCNQVGCRVIEMFLPFANDEILKRFADAFRQNLRPLCKDRFASHVLETLVTEVCKRTVDNEKNELREITIVISKFLLNNLEDYIWDTYGNHIIRTCIVSLAQIQKDDQELKDPKESIDVIISDSDMEIVNEFGKRLIAWPQFSELCLSEITSGFLQILLKALQKTDYDLFKKYIKKLLKEQFVDESSVESKSLCKVFLSKPLLMLLETVLQISSRKQFNKMYTKCFASKLEILATTRNTNFAVQKLILHCPDKLQFESIFDEITPHLQKVIETGHAGIVYALAQACKRLATKQGLYIQELMKALDCFEPEEKQNAFFVCVAKMENRMSAEKAVTFDKLNLQGTLIIQRMLEFNKPIKIINSILNTSTEHLKAIFSNCMGSHVIDAYVKSVFVGEKSREKLIRKLKGTYQDLASSKHGSRSFEAIWNVASLKFKLEIMEELAYKHATWSNNGCGTIIASKLNLSVFIKNKEQWKSSIQSTKNDLLSAIK